MVFPSLRRPSQGVLLVLVLAIAWVPASEGAAQSGRPAGLSTSGSQIDESIGADFPSVELGTLGTYRRALRRRELLRRPSGSNPREELQALVARGIGRDALELLRTVLSESPATTAELIAGVRYELPAVCRYKADCVDDLRTFVAAAKLKSAELPGEQAAELVCMAEALGWQLDDETTAQASIARFLADYDGTSAALVLQATRLEGLDGPQPPPAYMDFLERHEGTIAAAAARHARATRLESILRGGRIEVESWQQFLDEVAQLESGRYPDCEWVRQTPWPWISTEDAMWRGTSPHAADAVIAAHERFVRRELTGSNTRAGRWRSALYNVRALMRLQGKDETDFEQLVLSLEAAYPARGEELDWLLAETIESPPVGLAGDRAQQVARLKAVLNRLLTSANSTTRGKALASVASLHMTNREYAAARDAYRAYLSEYAHREFAWLATIRLGQAEQGLENEAEALAVFRGAAQTYSSNPFAAELALVAAGRLCESRGEFAAALADYTRALEIWDDDLPDPFTYPLGKGEDDPVTFVKAGKADLQRRATQLRASAQHPAGTVLERGRYLWSLGKWKEAEEVLDRAVRALPRSASQDDARYLLHRIRIARAFDGAFSPKQADRLEALELLNAIANEPYDFAVSVAKLARASLLFIWRLSPNGPSLLADAFRELHARRSGARASGAAPSDGDSAVDATAIRNLLYRPAGGGIYSQAQSFQSRRRRPYVVVHSEIEVSLGLRTESVRVSPSVPGVRGVLALSTGELSLLGEVLFRLSTIESGRAGTDGHKRWRFRSPTLMDAWNAFIEVDSMNGGWPVSRPAISRMRFLDASRSEAEVDVGLDGGGLKVGVRKVDGRWQAVKVHGLWDE